ncbi:MAG TPA: CPBP family intramembrane metalloprotease [Treponemataceae bacterium]|nr:CPBP family intramembrane metalloprotease [Treponemataceae bacterium]HQL05208.1 CPBP family intramembrane metalloprotease [Treponemataceae bacterium]
MTKRIFKLFLGIPVIFALLMAGITVLVSETAAFLLRDFKIINPQIILILFNFLLIITDSSIYFLMYRVILSKCNFSYRLGESIKKEWIEKKNICEKVKKDKRTFILIIVLFMILIIMWYFFSDYISSKTGIYPEKKPFLELSLLVAPIFEEFIFRKIYFEYCEINKVKHAFFINVIVFSFAHITPMPYVFLLGVILAYCYKKYNSLILNTAIHFLFNLLGLTLPPILNYFRQFL